jgi:hypothetical protein
MTESQGWTEIEANYSVARFNLSNSYSSIEEAIQKFDKSNCKYLLGYFDGSKLLTNGGNEDTNFIERFIIEKLYAEETDLFLVFSQNVTISMIKYVISGFSDETPDVLNSEMFAFKSDNSSKTLYFRHVSMI